MYVPTSRSSCQARNRKPRRFPVVSSWCSNDQAQLFRASCQQLCLRMIMKTVVVAALVLLLGVSITTQARSGKTTQKQLRIKEFKTKLSIGYNIYIYIYIRIKF